ncbi:MAG: MBL fold metallo-hydrolase [Bacteroidia bacterium]|nr:MAG: MBL fold metallo-hydrolase [Bacteroidia bacterium]
MIITLLGTGTSQGVPVVGCRCRVCKSMDPYDKRLRAAALVRSKHTNIVIDAGPDFRQQMLRANVQKLDGVLITHNHKDHTAGIDDVRAFNWIQKKPMDIYGDRRVLDSIKQDYSYAFEKEKYPGVPDIRLHTINAQLFNIEEIKIIPIKAMHHQMPVLGFRMGDFSYLTDANFIEKAELNKMKGSRLVVLNALRREKHISHFSLDEAVDILQFLRPEKGLITHISHQMGLRSEINGLLPAGISLAYDGVTIKL